MFDLMADNRDSDHVRTDDRTCPPASTTRYASPAELYRLMPEVGQLTQNRPLTAESGLEYLLRLCAGRTPEEAVTYVSFAALPAPAINWGYECLRSMSDHLATHERPMMELIAAWLSRPGSALRHRIAREALWATSRAPSVYLGLAVAWSGGSVAPNDPVLPAPHRAPRAVNTAILTCLARADLARRGQYLVRFTDAAEPLFRAY